MARPVPPALRLLVAVGAGSVAAGLLVGCTTGATAPPTSTATSQATVSPPPSAAPTTAVPPSAPGLQPSATALDNLPYFRGVADVVWASADSASGRAYVDALVAAGFDKAAMQVTSDTTTLGDPAESIQFAVLWSDGQCLVGQVGPATGALVTAVLPAVGDGTCLIGRTSPIDW